MNLLSIPSLLFHSSQTFPVAIKILADNNLFFLIEVINSNVVDGRLLFQKFALKIQLCIIFDKEVLKDHDWYHD
jgi:hypothetical protein